MSGAKTEEPTPRRLRKAREEGDSGASSFASQAIALVAAMALLPLAVVAIAGRAEERLRDAIQRAADVEPDVRAGFGLPEAAKDVALLSLPVVAGVALATALATLVQTGGFAGASRLSPKLERLNPFGRKLDLHARLVAVARMLAGGALASWIVLRALRVHMADLARTSGRLSFAAPTAATLVRAIGWEVAFAGLAIAVIDVTLVRAGRRRRLRMSRDEVARERREAEGDPLVKDARARARTAMIAAGGTAEVRTARVVVRDGALAAFALRYRDGDDAPVLIASRASRDGDDVDGLIREARAHRVAVAESADVARALGAATVGEAIPEALYDAVAEILRDTRD